MNTSDILNLRLQNQHLIGAKFKTPEKMVNHFSAVQAQDFAAAKWSVGQRVENATDELIEKAYNDGKILRTHIMRPTWHFVTPEDIRWIQKLTKDRVKQLMKTYNKKLELTDEIFAKCNKEITKALKGNNYLTRQELKRVLEKVGEKTDVQRLAHIIMWAELDSLIVSGPKKGKSPDPEGRKTVGQFTYALLDERVQRMKPISREESLAKLATKYFTSHGPAQLKDFAWWGGLTIKDSQSGISMISSKLQQEVVDGKIYWYGDRQSGATKSRAILQVPSGVESHTSHLLSIYDEYIIAYTDRTIVAGEFFKKLFTMGNALTGVVIVNGQVCATWKRNLKKEKVEHTIKPLRKLSGSEKLAIEKTSQEYSTFLKLESHFKIQ